MLVAALVIWTLGKNLFYGYPIFNVTGVLLAVFGVIYGVCAWIGIGLWKNNPHAKAWAIILFALQIPILAFPGFAEEFFTGLSLSILYDHGAHNISFNFEIASNLHFALSSQIEDWTVGINLIAVATLILLLQSPMVAEIPTISSPDSTPPNPQDVPPDL